MKKIILFLLCIHFSVAHAHQVTIFDGKTFDMQGSAEEIAKLRAFPLDKYQICFVPTLGYFYIDLLQDTIKATLSLGNIWEPNIVALIKKYGNEGSTIIDIGSHIGTHLVSMSQAVGEHGCVVGFEPQMKLFSELIMNMQLNQCHNVKAYRCALGKHFKTIQMNPACPSNEGGTAIGMGGDRAPLIPLDSLHLHSVSLIKIDVEGYEDEVLAGALKTIMQNRPYIIIELMDSTPALVKKRNNTLQHLESLGYSVTKLWGWDWFASPY